jgi:glycerol-3-phosphate acyltransferase PlsX
MANPLRQLGALLARGAFSDLKHRLDPEVYGGAVLLGLNGNVIKAHGSSRERAFMNAIRVATEEIQHDINHIIERKIAHANEQINAETRSPQTASA